MTRHRIAVGSVLARRELVTATGTAVRVPDDNNLVHLQFRRFAGCPLCNMHLHSMAQRHNEITDAGVIEVAVFHSSAVALRAYIDEAWPFALVGDPRKDLYRFFGVESSPRAILDPRLWPSEVRALRRRRGRPRFDLHGGPLGLPADFLIAPSGKVLACKYGEHAYDQWSVDELLGHAAEHTQMRRP